MDSEQADVAPDGARGGDGDDGGSSRRVFPPPRKLNDEQELEVTRLYAETNTPVADIASRFGIGESSVYRVAQRHGAALRGRRGRGAAADGASQAAPPPTAAPAEAPAAPRAGRTAAPRARARAAAPTPPRRAAAARPRGGAAGRARADAGAKPKGRFRVSFVAVDVIEAGTIHEAIAIVEARGATDITSVRRED
jgi:transposase-like protein